MPHQKIHQEKLKISPFHGLGIFDDVGTGKTISALNIVNNHFKVRNSPVLLLVPPTLFEKWGTEVRIWCGMNVNPVTPNKNGMKLSSGINILSHGKCHGDVPNKIPKIGLLIVDEAHHFRNEETQSSKFVLELCNNADERLLMTATPIQNSLEDLVSILNLTLPQLSRHVVKAIVTQAMGMNDHSMLRPIMTRCTPPTSGASRVIRDHLVEMSENERRFVFEIFESGRSSQNSRVSEISKMKMAASSLKTLQSFTGHENELRDSKVLYTSGLVNEICESGGKAIVFSEFINTAKEISSNLGTNLIGTITGDTPSETRSAFLTGLKHSNSGAIVMTDVGGEGLDMQFVDCIVNHDLPWNPMILEQRIGRLDRIGRDDRDVAIHNILLKDSLDSHIVKILNNKQVVSQKFGGYGRMIEPARDLASINSTFQFSSLSSHIYELDISEANSRDFGILLDDGTRLMSLIGELS